MARIMHSPDARFPSLDITAAMAQPEGIRTCPSVGFMKVPSFRFSDKKKKRPFPHGIPYGNERLCSSALLYACFFSPSSMKCGKRKQHISKKRPRNEKLFVVFRQIFHN
jgi:hypothetical protein